MKKLSMVLGGKELTFNSREELISKAADSGLVEFKVKEEGKTKKWIIAQVVISRSRLSASVAIVANDKILFDPIENYDLVINQFTSKVIYDKEVYGASISADSYGIDSTHYGLGNNPLFAVLIEAEREKKDIVVVNNGSNKIVIAIGSALEDGVVFLSNSQRRLYQKLPLDRYSVSPEDISWVYDPDDYVYF